MNPTGTYVTTSTAGERFQAFVPDPLPPESLGLTDPDHALIGRAHRALGELDGVASLLPSIDLLLYFYVRKEAVLSSQIEGTQSSMSDLLLHEEQLPVSVPLDDVQEVCNYVAAIGHGLDRMEEGFPISLRLIRELHKILLSKGRGSNKTPGEFRRSQNWIGGTRPGNARFVPPPPERLMECMGDLEKFLHNQPVETQPLVKAALIHVQFETIHPFLDGNGRVGRLLIPMLLLAEGVLARPYLYLSIYFKRHQMEYYDRLDAVRTKGDWIGWLRFFLEGVEATASQAAQTTRQVAEQLESDQMQIGSLGRSAESCLTVWQQLKRHPITTVPRSAQRTGLSAPTIRSSIGKLESLGLLKEITGKRRDRIYEYTEYIQILDSV
jgi:Fic family protein